MPDFGGGLRYCQCGHEVSLHFHPGDACSYCACKRFVDRNRKAEPPQPELEADWNG